MPLDRIRRLFRNALPPHVSAERSVPVPTSAEMMGAFEEDALDLGEARTARDRSEDPAGTRHG